MIPIVGSDPLGGSGHRGGVIGRGRASRSASSCSSSCSSSSRTTSWCRRSCSARSASARCSSSWRCSIGGSLLGVIGAILAVPTAAILQVLFEELIDTPRPLRCAGPARAWRAYTAIAIVMTWPLAGGSRATSRGTSAIRCSTCGSWRGTASSSAASRRPLFAPPPFLRRQHLSSGAADAGLLRASDSAGAAGVSDLRGHEESDPLLQPAVPLDVRAVGLGMFLFARELTGSAAAGVRRGPAVRVRAVSDRQQSSHLQVLSSQWMPFALYGSGGIFDGGRMRALAGAAAAWSCRTCRAATTCCISRRSCSATSSGSLARRTCGATGERWIALVARRDRCWPRDAVRDCRTRASAASFSSAIARRNDASLRRRLLLCDRDPNAERFWGSRSRRCVSESRRRTVSGPDPVLLALDWDRGRCADQPRVEAAPARYRRRSERAGIIALITWPRRLATIALPPFDTRSVAVRLRLDRRHAAAVARARRVRLCAYALSPSAPRAAGFMRSRGFFVVALLAAIWLSSGLSPQVLGRPARSRVAVPLPVEPRSRF